MAGTPAPFAQETGWRPSAYLKASNPDEDDHLSAGSALLGTSLALSADGTTMAIGAPHEDGGARGIGGNGDDNSAFDAGAAYVFVRVGTRWAQQAYLKASNTQAGDGFGFAVALSADGNTLAVSANFEDSAGRGVGVAQDENMADGSGAVYVFVRRGTTWSQQAYVKPSNTDDGDRFGYAVALSADGHLLAAGAIGEDSAATGIDGDQADNSAAQAGAGYVFERRGTTWSQQAYLKASNAQAGDLFGFCLDLSDDGATLAVCAYDEDSSAQGVNGDEKSNASGGSGAAYVFTRSGGAWRQDAYIKASNTTLQMAFGAALTVSGDGRTLAVCAIDEDGLSAGVDATPWQADRRPEERTRVAEASAGAVYVYTRGDQAWSFASYLKPSNIRANDYFGMRLAINRDGTLLAAASPQQPGGGRGVEPAARDASAPESGAVYVFMQRSGRWAQEAYIKAPNADEYDQFGTGLALTADGRLMAVGAMGEDGAARGVNLDQSDNSVRDAGAAYVFVR